MSEQAPAGWYPDGSGNERYWDGGAWTSHLRTPVPSETVATGANDGYRARTYRGSDLEGFDLRGADLTGSTFVDLDWAGRDLSEAVLDDTRFIGGTLAQGSLAFASIIGARLENVDLRGASLEGANIRGTRFVEVDLTAANLTMVRMNESMINGARLDRTSFRSARLIGSGFNFVRGEAADFRGAVLNTLTWAGEDTLDIVLPFTDFSGATIQGITWPGARLDGTNFSDASLDHAVFARANLSDAVFRDASLSSVIFDDADLSRADFTESYEPTAPAGLFSVPAEPRSARLQNVAFAAADLTNARFDGAILLRCDLAEANATAAEFQGTRFDECELDGIDWTEAAPGWLRSDEEARTKMFNTFIGDGIALPYVPLEEDFDILPGEGTLFHSHRWSSVTANDLYSFDTMTDRLGSLALPEGFAVSMGGHGSNSYAWTWACAENNLRATIQIARRQGYRSSTDVARRWDEAMRGASRVFDLDRPVLPAPLTVEFSDMRQVARWYWIAPDPSSRATASTPVHEWQGDHTNVKAFFDDFYTYLQSVIDAS